MNRKPMNSHRRRRGRSLYDELNSRDYLVERISDGWTARRIAREIGCDKSTVNRAIEYFALQRRRSRLPDTRTAREKIRERLRAN